MVGSFLFFCRGWQSRCLFGRRGLRSGDCIGRFWRRMRRIEARTKRLDIDIPQNSKKSGQSVDVWLIDSTGYLRLGSNSLLVVLKKSLNRVEDSRPNSSRIPFIGSFGLKFQLVKEGFYIAMVNSFIA